VDFFTGFLFVKALFFGGGLTLLWAFFFWLGDFFFLGGFTSLAPFFTICLLSLLCGGFLREAVLFFLPRRRDKNGTGLGWRFLGGRAFMGDSEQFLFSSTTTRR